jgi:glycine dehydrogenase
VHLLTELLRARLRALGYTVNAGPIFDTLKVSGGPRSQANRSNAGARQQHQPALSPTAASASRSTSRPRSRSCEALLRTLRRRTATRSVKRWPVAVMLDYAAPLARSSAFLTHPVFNSYHSETRCCATSSGWRSARPLAGALDDPARLVHDEAQRHHRDAPVTWPEFANLHPFAPRPGRGLPGAVRRLEAWLAEITGFAATSLQPNAGSQGEYAGLLTIRGYHHARGEGTATSA